MNESQISVRYAKALFQSASEKQLLERVYKDMELLSQTCKLEDFRFLLLMPSLQVSQKWRFVETIFSAHMCKVSMAMINLVIQNKRESYLTEIARNYNDLFRKSKGILVASLITAQPVEEATIQSIKTLIASTSDSEVELSADVDKDLIGGFVLTIEGQRYDASVATSLKKMKKQLLQPV